MMNVSMEDAYREACLALGEAVVRERLLVAEVARLNAQEVTTLANGRRVYPAGDGAYVAADEGGWLDGSRPTVEAWATD